MALISVPHSIKYGISYHGRRPFRVYISFKYGLKIWSMCDVSSSYLYNLQVYFGKEGELAEQPQEARVVRDLATPVYRSGRNIITDNFFTSHELAKFLLGQNLTLSGTCLSECFRCLVYDASGVETQRVAQTTFIPACRCVRHDAAYD